MLLSISHIPTSESKGELDPNILNIFRNVVQEKNLLLIIKKNLAKMTDTFVATVTFYDKSISTE